jgi:hypothetical protein
MSLVCIWHIGLLFKVAYDMREDIMWTRFLGPFVSDTHSFAAVCRCYCFVVDPARHRCPRRQLRRLYLF